MKHTNLLETTVNYSQAQNYNVSSAERSNTAGYKHMDSFFGSSNSNTQFIKEEKNSNELNRIHLSP